MFVYKYACWFRQRIVTKNGKTVRKNGGIGRFYVLFFLKIKHLKKMYNNLQEYYKLLHLKKRKNYFNVTY